MAKAPAISSGKVSVATRTKQDLGAFGIAFYEEKRRKNRRGTVRIEIGEVQTPKGVGDG